MEICTKLDSVYMVWLHTNLRQVYQLGTVGNRHNHLLATSYFVQNRRCRVKLGQFYTNRSDCIFCVIPSNNLIREHGGLVSLEGRFWVKIRFIFYYYFEGWSIVRELYWTRCRWKIDFVKSKHYFFCEIKRYNS